MYYQQSCLKELAPSDGHHQIFHITKESKECKK